MAPGTVRAGAPARRKRRGNKIVKCYAGGGGWIEEGLILQTKGKMLASLRNNSSLLLLLLLLLLLGPRVVLLPSSSSRSTKVRKHRRMGSKSQELSRGAGERPSHRKRDRLGEATGQSGVVCQ